MEDLEGRVRKLEQEFAAFGHEIRLAYHYIHPDCASSLTKSRMVMEKILVRIYEAEMGKGPRKPLLGEMLADNQLTRKIDRRILSRMNAIRDMGNLGPHGEPVRPDDAERVLDDLCTVLDWCLTRYAAQLRKRGSSLAGGPAASAAPFPPASGAGPPLPAAAGVVPTPEPPLPVPPRPRRKRKGPVIALLLGAAAVAFAGAAGALLHYAGLDTRGPASSPRKAEEPTASRRDGEPAAPAPRANSLGMKFVLVPRGTFWMGDRGSQRPVTIEHDFYIGVYPVTQEQWQAVMGSNPSCFCRTGTGANEVKDIADADLRQFPVEKILWEDAQRFIEKLNVRERGRGLVYRLPTEAEWEYACRGAASSPEECAFDFYLDPPINDLSSEQANFNGNFPAGNAPKGKYLARTTKVGSYQPNRLGIYDMHGNVWQYCDGLDEAGRPHRVIRGGALDRHGSDCRASYRDGGQSKTWDYTLGLRLAAVPSGE
jgi:formylglycine-generating enzyme required for sulfatase activity